MIKNFRAKHRLSQAQLAALIGIKKDALIYLERHEDEKDMSKSKNMDKVVRFMRRYEVQIMANKVYRSNQSLIKEANKTYKPVDNVITSVLPIRNKSLLTRIWEWINAKF